jgi:HEAT repeat protein
MRYIVCIFFLFGCAPSEAELTPREHLRGLISGYEQGPKRASLDAAPGDVVGGLLALAEDPSEKRFYRARALTALGLYPEDERAYQLLFFVVQEVDTGLLERSSAIRSLSQGFDATHPDEVARLLSPLLQDISPLLQKAATEALLHNPSHIAKEAVLNYQKTNE